ncbi:MAG: hypothetical protein IV100_02595 [Myxococcales bacterium]|nr:hypothetical protein [Myxococcales bacterium]
MLSALTFALTLAMAPPAFVRPMKDLLGDARVVTDVRSGLPRAVFGLSLPLHGAGDAASARAALEQLAPALGLSPDLLGPVAVSGSRFGTVYSFELLAPTDGIPLPFLERRVALRIQNGLVTTIHSDAVRAPSLTFGPAGLDAPDLVTADAAATLAMRHTGGVAGVPHAFALSLAPGHIEPIWRIPIVVLPFVDHRWVDVAMRGGRVIRDVPSAKDGHRVGGAR